MQRSHIKNVIGRLVVCTFVVFVITAVLYALPLSDRSLTAAFTFLFVVLAFSAVWGFRYAVFVSLLSALGFSLLAPPVGYLHLTYSRDVFALVSFLVIGLVASYLSDRARREARVARVEITKREQAETVLRQRADLLDLTHDTVFVRDMSDVITYWNRGAEELYGWKQDEAIGQVSHQLMRTNFPAPLEEINAELLRAGRWEGELTHTKRDGTQVVVASRWSLQRDHHGTPIAILETNNDITERKRAEEALRRNEAYFAEAQRLSHTGSWAWEAKTLKVLYCSDETLRIFGFDPQDGVPTAEGFEQRMYPEDHDNTHEIVWKAVGRKADYAVDHRIVLPDGTVKYIQTIGHPVLDATGEVVEYVGTSVDVTERKRAEEELRETETRFRSYVDHATDALFVHDAQWKIVDVNGQACESLGYTREEMIGMTPSDFNPSLDAVSTQRFREAFEAGEICTFETSHRRKDGTVFPVEVRVRLLRHDGHSFSLALARDITDRKRAEMVLRERASLLDLTHDTVFVRDMSDVITYWNRGAEDLYGWSRDEAIGKVAHQLTQTIFPGPVEEINAELLRAGRWEGELTHTKRDGTQVVVASRWSLQRDELRRPTAVLETNNDITERKQAEAKLRESEEQWRDVFENNPTMYFMVDAAGNVLSVNPFGAEQLGYTVDELVGQPVTSVFPKSDREAVRRNLASCLGQIGLARSWEARKVRKNGTLIMVRETAKAVPRVNGPIVLIACEDITEQRRTEEALRAAQTDLARVSRVTTMGELTASLAHEVNQPITAAVTNARTCVRWLAANTPNISEARDAAILSAEDATRAAEIISRIRLLFQKGPIKRELVDVNEVIGEMMLLLRAEATRYSVSMRTDLAAGIPQIMADRVQLQQVMMNLLMNSIEAMKDVEGSREVIIKSDRAENEQLLVSVSDTGVGLPTEQREQIFNAFFTTKLQGTGMGLSISRSIVESHGGHLSAANNAPRGAIFQFTLSAKPEAKA